MNVKPEDFEATKQTILKNKKQFMEIQLGEVSKRIAMLKNENTNLKSQIKQLKAKPTEIVTSALTTRQMGESNKQNKCINLFKNKNKGVESQATTHRAQDKENYEQYEKEGKQIKEMELIFSNQQKQRQKELAYLEDYIKILKQLWEEKQRNPSKIVTETFFTNKNEQVQNRKQKSKSLVQDNVKQIGKSIQLKSFKLFQPRPQGMLTSTESLNQSQIESNNENSQIVFNNSNFFNSSNFLNNSQDSTNANTSYLNNQKYSVKPNRKTMSLSMNGSSNNLMMGFKFGKKSINRKKDDEVAEVSYINGSTNSSGLQKQMRPSSISISFPRQTLNESINQNSILNRSNSRTSMSILSNAGSNKSTLRKSEASKSYAKIVTKLKCYGCAVQFRPNQYYTHVENCRDLLKLKLLEEKEKIEDEINQTLNLSISHF